MLRVREVGNHNCFAFVQRERAECQIMTLGILAEGENIFGLSEKFVLTHHWGGNIPDDSSQDQKGFQRICSSKLEAKRMI